MTLPDLISWQEVQRRLKIIFPEGTAHRAYLTRDQAARTVFVALYIGAVEGFDNWLAPKHVYRMSDKQALKNDQLARATYAAQIMKPGKLAPGRQWYRDTTREPIRDETLREGFVAIGAYIEKPGVPTTSNRGRYAMQRAFAELFSPNLKAKPLREAIDKWQAETLSKGALARIAIVRRGAAVGSDHVTVSFPNGETRRMKPGPSSQITKAVIEVFAPCFLGKPAVLFVSESGNKIVARDDELARAIGVIIKADENLPDIILVDLEPRHPLMVFVEAVATDGPINLRRKAALERLASDAGFPAEHVALVTAYHDRSSPPFKKTVDALAWGSYAWCASEPDGLIELSAMRGRLK
jgi:BsuBI/PstI restriction endonuclease domain/BsuBI/PstI restriction endonuclease HTH domain